MGVLVAVDVGVADGVWVGVLVAVFVGVLDGVVVWVGSWHWPATQSWFAAQQAPPQT